MAALGYVEADKGNQAIEVATRMRYLVPLLYLASALLMLVGLGLVYNHNKKKLDEMNTALGRNVITEA